MTLTNRDVSRLGDRVKLCSFIIMFVSVIHDVPSSRCLYLQQLFRRSERLGVHAEERSAVSARVTGLRCNCRLSLSQVSCLSHIAANYLNAGKEARRWGTAHESIVPYQVTPSTGHYLTITLLISHLQHREKTEKTSGNITLNQHC